jgi:hypothetical protein
MTILLGKASVETKKVTPVIVQFDQLQQWGMRM